MIYKTYTPDKIDEVKRLFENGNNKSEIHRITGIPRSTVTNWIHPTYIRKTDFPRNSYTPITNFDEHFNTPEKRAAYSFILAVYLCDGWINQKSRIPRILLINDAKYSKNIEEWRENLAIIFPNNIINVKKRTKSNSVDVSCYSKQLNEIFPQSGKGPKHDRKMVLMDWQETIIQEYPEKFIRGCIQSDGCIYHQKVGNYAYKRYNFINKSEDVIDFFLRALNFKGIKKEKYFQKNRGLFVVQNFKKDDLSILENIISNKE